MRWWAWLLVVVGIVVLAVLAWRMLRRSRRPRPRRPMAVPMAVPPAPRISHAAPVSEPPSESCQDGGPADDLTRIEGIGPKIASTLRDAGITTFGQLAEMGPERLAGILRQANLRLADPSTWPEQAALAAAGRWQELATLQSRLRGGRRE